MKTKLKRNEDRKTGYASNFAIRTCRKVMDHLRNVRHAIENEFAAARAGHRQLIHLALNEAEALAWQTAYPHLMFPVLAREKVQAVSRWEARQAAILRQERQLAFAA